MAAVTSSVITGGLGLYQGIKGMADKKQGVKDLNSYDRQKLTNAYENRPISTMGSDYLAEQSQLASSNLVEASRNGGIRGVLGAIPGIQAENNRQAQIGANYIDDQVTRRYDNIAQDNVRIQNMTENRDNNNLADINSRIQSGNQDMWSGMMGVAKAGIYAANNIDWDGKGSQADNDLAKLGSSNMNSSMDANSFNSRFYKSQSSSLLDNWRTITPTKANV
jgi:hypothetical protein